MSCLALLFLCILLAIPLQSQQQDVATTVCPKAKFKTLCEDMVKSSPAQDKKTLVRHGLNLSISTVNEMDKILSTYKCPNGNQSTIEICTTIHKEAMDVLLKSMDSLETGGYQVMKIGLETAASDSGECGHALSDNGNNPISEQGEKFIGYCLNTVIFIDELKG
ncbi:hypothetical protein M5689_023395 [Euphorbia peplus]|nr:hypothetical protein M5689_023395 [Euphorbia peplus]